MGFSMTKGSDLFNAKPSVLGQEEFSNKMDCRRQNCLTCLLVWFVGVGVILALSMVSETTHWTFIPTFPSVRVRLYFDLSFWLTKNLFQFKKKAPLHLLR